MRNLMRNDLFKYWFLCMTMWYPGAGGDCNTTELLRLRRQTPGVSIKDKLAMAAQQIMNCNDEYFKEAKKKKYEPFQSVGLFGEPPRRSRIMSTLCVGRARAAAAPPTDEYIDKLWPHSASHGSCKNMFITFANEFEKAGLDYSEEVERCGYHIRSNPTLHTRSRRSKQEVRRIVASKGWHKPGLYNTKDGRNFYPWAVNLRISFSFDVRIRKHRSQETILATYSEFGYCSGTIIHRRFILTAAHCMPEIRIFFIIQALVDRDNTEEANKIKQYIRYWDKGKEFNLVDGDVILVEGPMLDALHVNSRTEIRISYGPNVTFEWNPKLKCMDYSSSTAETIIIPAGRYFNHVSLNPHFVHLSHTLVVEAAIARKNKIGCNYAFDEEAGISDIALIYLPKEIVYTDDYTVVPACMPGYKPGSNKGLKGYQKCAPQYNESFYMAGYGVTQEEPQYIKAKGLNAGKFKVLSSRYYREDYMGSSLIYRALDNENMDDIEDAPNKILASTEVRPAPNIPQGVPYTEYYHQMISSGDGDSGAAGVFPRKMTNKAKSSHAKMVNKNVNQRMTLLTVLSCRAKKTVREYGADIILHAEWIAKEMAHFKRFNKRKTPDEWFSLI